MQWALSLPLSLTCWPSPPVALIIVTRLTPRSLGRDVWFGAAVTVLFMIGVLIGMYLGRGVWSAYGAAGSLAVLLWLYYASQIFLLGPN